MKKFLSIFTALALVLSLTSCGETSPKNENPTGTQTNDDNPAPTDATGSSDEAVTIKFFHRWPQEPRSTYYDEVIAEFEAQNPDIKVEMESVINDSYKEKIRVLVSSNEIPDIFSAWSDSFTENLVKSEKIKPIDYLLEEDTQWSSQILASQFENFKVDGKTYAVPFTIDGKAFFYNKDVFDKHGLEEPKTYSELISILETLKAEFNGAPLIEGLTDTWAISHYQGTIFQRLIDPAVIEKDYLDATAEFTDPGYLKGLEIFEELASYMGPNATSIDHTEARASFIAGEHAVIYLQLGELKQIEDGSKAGSNFAYSYFNFPEIEGGKGDPNQLTGAPEGFMLSNVATGKKAEAAEKLLKFLTSKENGEKFISTVGAPVSIEGAANENSTFPAMIEANNFIKESSGSWPWFDNAVNINIADAFMKGAQSVVVGSTTNEDVMKSVHEEVSKLK